MTDEHVVQSRLRMLPPIRRARLWRLYAEDGRRFLDFWMDGGRSILGAKGTGIGTIAKAGIDTGLTRPFPSVREARLEKALLAHYQGYKAARFFRDEARALEALQAAGLLRAGETPPLLRPFAEHLAAKGELEARARGAAPAAHIAMPLLPCPAVLGPVVLLFAESGDAQATSGELVPPLLLACALRALGEFDRFSATYDKSLWKKVDRRLGPFFERRGPYLYPLSREEDYDKLFRAALGAGVLLSPSHELPSIIPGDFDDGELARLAKALVDEI
jgi:hypothetical protein